MFKLLIQKKYKYFNNYRKTGFIKGLNFNIKNVFLKNNFKKTLEKSLK